MPAAGQAVSGVEDVLRARANARRIKEHYEGTLGVPSELQSLGHLLSHDKDAVFSGLENLPFYSKSSVPAPPKPIPDPAASPEPTPVRCRRTHGLPSCVTSRSSFDKLPSSPGKVAPPLASHVEPDGWDQGADASGGAGADTQQVPVQQQQPELSFSVPTPPEALEEVVPEQYPMQPGCRVDSPSRVRLPCGLSLDPWRYIPSEDFVQVVEGGASNFGAGLPAAADPWVPPLLGRPESRSGGGGAADGSAWSVSSSRQASPTGRGSATGAMSYPGRQATTGGGSGCGSPVGPAVAVAGAGESEEERKYRLAQQRLLSANDLSPQDWARIGPPQDAVDVEKFTARGYSMSVDFDRQTLMPKRVARPDIFHISPEEAQRRQVEADEATLALQAQRRAEEEAAEAAAEQERLARSAQRGPRYDALGVRQVQRSSSPVLPRYLDWHPDTVGGLHSQRDVKAPLVSSRRTASSGSIGGGGAASSGVAAHVSRCASAARARPMSAAAGLHGLSYSVPCGGRGGGAAAATAGGRPSTLDHQLAHTRLMDPAALGLAPDTYVYEDTGDDPAADNEDGGGGATAYDTRPLRRRHHSAVSCAFTPPPRPPGVSDACYAQIVRQQRKWLNAPVQPPRPLSAFPAPVVHLYLRPRSSRPAPEGTAAPLPSRDASGLAASSAAQRPSTALSAAVTIHRHASASALPPRPQSRGGHTPTGLAPASATSRPASATTSIAAGIPVQLNPWPIPPPPLVRQHDGARPASARAPSDMGDGGAAGSVQLMYGPPRKGKRLPWEAREHVAAAAAVGIIPPPISLETGDSAPPPGGAAGGSAAASSAAAAAVAAANQRRSSTGLSGTSAGARSRASSAAPRRGQRQQQQQQQQARSIIGETVPPEGANREGSEQYLPRKFELREGMVLDGYMGRW